MICHSGAHSSKPAMLYGSTIPSGRKALVQSSNAHGKDHLLSPRDSMTWFIEFNCDLQQSQKLFIGTDYGSTVVMILHPGFKGTKVTHLLSQQIRGMIMNTSQMIMNTSQMIMNTSQMIMNTNSTNSPMTVGTNSWKIMNNLSHSEEANDQENLQIDFNPIELLGGEKCDS